MVYKIKNDKFALHLKKYKIMYKLVLIFGLHSGPGVIELIPIFGMLTGIIIPLSVFLWLYHDAKNKRATVLEISKNIQDKEKLDELLKIFDERKKEPIDYRRTGVVTLFTGVGLFLFGVFFLGEILMGVGALVTAIGIGQIIAGYLYPNTSEEINQAVDAFEKK